MPQPPLSADQRALLKALYRFYRDHAPDTCVSPKDLSLRIGLGVGEAGAAIAGLFVKELLTLVDTEMGHLSKDGLILAMELFDEPPSA